MTKIITLIFLLLFSLNAKAQDCELRPFKDDLFAPVTLTSPEQIYAQEKRISDDYPGEPFYNTSVADSAEINWQEPDVFINRRYNKFVHISDWDEVPRRKAKRERVKLILPELKTDGLLSFSSGRSLEVVKVGSSKGASFAIIFIHGLNGDKTLGVNDWSFGGNFNRLQNLVTRNNGVYYSPTVNADKDIESVGDLVEVIHNNNPDIPVIMACGSAGGKVCTFLQESSKYAAMLGGVIYLGSAVAPVNITETPAYESQTPTIFAHGSYDTGLPWQQMKVRFDDLRSKDPSYPTKFYLYHGGVHGTPIRMIDWREVLNYILSIRC